MILKGVFDSGDCPETWTAVCEQLGVQFSVEAFEQRARQWSIVRACSTGDHDAILVRVCELQGMDSAWLVLQLN